MPNVERLIRRDEITAVTGYDISNIYRLMRAGRFPAPVQIGPRAVAWRASDIAQWQASLPTGVKAPVTRPAR